MKFETNELIDRIIEVSEWQHITCQRVPYRYNRLFLRDIFSR